ncbi:MAG: molybdopterin converting factor subunit 1 [Flavobacteriales bacterium]|nr:molybdopterin converting factor subunit 1 [Flavobacteriales bacterium]
MRLNALTFGLMRDLCGGSTLQLVVPENTTVGGLLDHVAARYPARGLRQTLRVAVNQEYANEDLVLNEGDEIALIPPVSGG